MACGYRMQDKAKCNTQVQRTKQHRKPFSAPAARLCITEKKMRRQDAITIYTTEHYTAKSIGGSICSESRFRHVYV